MPASYLYLRTILKSQTDYTLLIGAIAAGENTTAKIASRLGWAPRKVLNKLMFIVKPDHKTNKINHPLVLMTKKKRQRAPAEYDLNYDFIVKYMLQRLDDDKHDKVKLLVSSPIFKESLRRYLSDVAHLKKVPTLDRALREFIIGFFLSESRRSSLMIQALAAGQDPYGGIKNMPAQDAVALINFSLACRYGIENMGGKVRRCAAEAVWKTIY